MSADQPGDGMGSAGMHGDQPDVGRSVAGMHADQPDVGRSVAGMRAPISRAEAETLLFTEAAYLDQRRWDEWLALYLPDATFWMPAWRDEVTPTADPDRELSLIYYHGKRNLEDRVERLRSGQSVASTPLPRVVHMISNVLVDSSSTAAATLLSNFAVHLHDVRAERTHIFFGHYRHQLARVDDGWRIAGKTITLLNDVIPTVVDFYAI